MSENIMQSDWIIGYYEGERAKSVLAHADAGIGYFLLERGGNRHSPAVRVAFRYASDGPLPLHLEAVVDEKKIRDYENMWRSRHGKDRLPTQVSTLGVRI